MKKILSIAISALLLAGIVSSCAPPPDEDASVTTVSQDTSTPSYDEQTVAEDDGDDTDETMERTGGVLEFGEYVLDTQLANLNPFVSGNWTGLRNYIYEELYYFNGVTGELVPTLASDFEWSEDYKTLTLQLNTDATWHDGEDFSSDDVVFTFEMLRDVPLFDTHALWDTIASVEADGEDAVVFTLNEQLPALLTYISYIYIVPEHIWSSEDPEAFTNPQPIGTGPFIFDKYTVGTDVQMDSNMDYWRGAPQIDRIICKIYNSSSNVTLAFMNGDIEYTMGTVAMPNVPEILNIEGAHIQYWPGPSNFVVHLNHENEFLQDVVLRKALNMSIDPDKMLEIGNYGIAYPVGPNWLHQTFGDYQNTDYTEDLTYGIEGAKAYLEENGYSFNGDGKLLSPSGALVELSYVNASGAPAQQEQANMIQQWFSDMGISIVAELATWPEMSEKQRNGDYDMLQAGISFIPSPYAALGMFHSKATAPTGENTPGLNYFRYRNDTVDDLLDQAASELDNDALLTLVHDIQSQLSDDYVFVPMYNGGPKAPYHTTRFEGFDTGVPIFHPISLIQVRAVG